MTTPTLLTNSNTKLTTNLRSDFTTNGNCKKINRRKNNVLTSTLSCALIVASISSTNVFASSGNVELQTDQQRHDSAQTREEVGFGVGMVVGAIVAGPIGAVITGVAGNFVAKHMNANDEIDHLATSLAQSQTSNEQQIAQYQRSYETKLQQAEQSYQNELIALENNYRSAEQIKAEQLLMSLQFSTGSSDIAPHYQEQVAVLAQLLNSDPGLSVDLSGYTDLEGDETLNQNLSKARVASVKELLMAQGVSEERIQSFAFGEAQPLVADSQSEVNFYDRRVVLQVKTANSQTAKN